MGGHGGTVAFEGMAHRQREGDAIPRGEKVGTAYSLAKAVWRICGRIKDGGGGGGGGGSVTQDCLFTQPSRVT